MRFSIQHRTHYSYNTPAVLSPHDLRFYPRDDGSQRVLQHQLTIDPLPAGQAWHMDAEGNRVLRVWFDKPVNDLSINVQMMVETTRTNPYHFILEPQSLTMPLDYGSERDLLSAYFRRVTPDYEIDSLAARFTQEAGGDPLRFLNLLNDFLHRDFRHERREDGPPLPPAQTLRRRYGPCRDLTLLFMDCCRAGGIAARFASGYRHAETLQEKRDLHAWPEAYLPGAGWRGFDPTHGEFIADTHVTIAASARAAMTMPVIGHYSGAGVNATLEYRVNIESA